MSGTKAGGLKAAATNKAKYGEDFYRKQGKKGGSAEHKFRYLQINPQFAAEIGHKGGTISRRGPAKAKEVVNE